MIDSLGEVLDGWGLGEEGGCEQGCEEKNSPWEGS